MADQNVIAENQNDYEKRKRWGAGGSSSPGDPLKECHIEIKYRKRLRSEEGDVE